jgi:hypothetical protein
MNVVSVLPTRAAGTVTPTHSALSPPPEIANRVDEPVTEVVPTVAVMVALPSWW